MVKLLIRDATNFRPVLVRVTLVVEVLGGKEHGNQQQVLNVVCNVPLLLVE